jgi:hypothetical protein
LDRNPQWFQLHSLLQFRYRLFWSYLRWVRQGKCWPAPGLVESVCHSLPVSLPCCLTILTRQVFPHHVVDDVDSRESYDELATAQARARAARQAES